jgi:poly-gamma-glutamate synthesis protein (capsule biosynthesis protein)
MLFATPTLASDPLCPADGVDFSAFYTDRAMIAEALEKAQDFAPLAQAPLGLTVPHHLLADQLVAGGIRLAAGHEYDRVILLTPDHFRRAKTPFATTTRGFETVRGKVASDAEAARALLAATPLAEESCLFAREHGAHALLPFVAEYLPGTPVLTVAISIRSTRDDWEKLAEALTPLVGERTLILQSTDFSHYLPHHGARVRDQQTLNVLASGSLDAIAALNQPEHLDSAGAMYVQTALQQRLRGLSPRVLANENGQQYSQNFIAETTSYMVLAFMPPGAPPTPLPAGAKRFFLAGDTFFGRRMSGALLDEMAAGRVENAVLKATGGAPIVANLEGVLLPDVPSNLDHLVLAMPAEQAVAWLKRLNVTAVSLANNHAYDIGPTGYAETADALDTAGIGRFGQGERLDIEGVALVGLTDLGTNASQQVMLIDDALLGRLTVEDAATPVVAFVHWGEEYVPEPGRRERELAEAMRTRGVAAIVGAHPHRASQGVAALGGGDTALVYSLGNFLFDQTAARGSGALAEITAFDQGTIYVRPVDLPNLYDLALGARP